MRPPGYDHVCVFGVLPSSLFSVTLTPGSSTAFARRSRAKSGSDTFGASKYFGSGTTRTVVPVLRAPTVPTTFSFSATSPPANTIRCTFPSRLTSTSSRFDSALVTDTPTPCRPPENA